MQDAAHGQHQNVAPKITSRLTGDEYEAELENGQAKILGRGTFGEVFQAKNITKNKPVAIKCITGGENEKAFLELRNVAQ